MILRVILKLQDVEAQRLLCQSRCSPERTTSVRASLAPLATSLTRQSAMGWAFSYGVGCGSAWLHQLRLACAARTRPLAQLYACLCGLNQVSLAFIKASTLWRYSARFHNGVFAHVRWASLAALKALSTSSFVHAADVKDQVIANSARCWARSDP